MASGADDDRRQIGQAEKGSAARRTNGPERQRSGGPLISDPHSGRVALSPLLSNILLHELDRELERRGCKYVRYADDFSIYWKKKTEARKIGNSVFLFLKNKLKLPINREKSGIRRPVNFKLLGYEFVPTYEKGSKGKYQLVVSESGWKELKEKIRTITSKTAPLSLAERV